MGIRLLGVHGHCAWSIRFLHLLGCLELGPWFLHHCRAILRKTSRSHGPLRGHYHIRIGRALRLGKLRSWFAKTSLPPLERKLPYLGQETCCHPRRVQDNWWSNKVTYQKFKACDTCHVATVDASSYFRLTRHLSTIFLTRQKCHSRSIVPTIANTYAPI